MKKSSIGVVLLLVSGVFILSVTQPKKRHPALQSWINACEAARPVRSNVEENYLDSLKSLNAISFEDSIMHDPFTRHN